MSDNLRAQVKALLLRLDYHHSAGNHSEVARITRELDELIREES